MKKFTLLMVAVLGFATMASAQTFGKGTKDLTASIGFGGGGTPIALSYEQGIYDFAADHKLGLGGYVGFYSSSITPAVECNYHFVGVDKLDLYGGVRFGFIIVDGGSTTFDTFSVGANYSLDSKWAVNVELGSGVGSIGLGVTYKL
ncbi:MAG: hypothetical protein SNH94_00020 [Rikenellaceae bacterium]